MAKQLLLILLLCVVTALACSNQPEDTTDATTTDINPNHDTKPNDVTPNDGDTRPIDNICSDSKPCTGEKVCKDGTCTDPEVTPMCFAGTKKCEDNWVKTCNADGSGYDDGIACDEHQTCTDGACVDTTPPPQTCQPNATRCENRTVQTCKADGSAWDTTTCGTGQICTVLNGTATCSAPRCATGEQRCNNNLIQTCNHSLDGWTDSTTCASNQSCIEDATHKTASCENQVCTDGQTKCENNNIVICKNDQTGFELSKDCTSRNKICSLSGGTPTCVNPDAQTCRTAIPVTLTQDDSTPDLFTASLSASFTNLDTNDLKPSDASCVEDAAGQDHFYKVTVPQGKVLNVELDNQNINSTFAYLMEDCTNASQICLAKTTTQDHQLIYYNQTGSDKTLYIVVDQVQPQTTPSYVLDISTYSPKCTHPGTRNPTCDPATDILTQSCEKDYRTQTEVCSLGCNQTKDACVQAGKGNNCDASAGPFPIIRPGETMAITLDSSYGNDFDISTCPYDSGYIVPSQGNDTLVKLIAPPGSTLKIELQGVGNVDAFLAVMTTCDINTCEKAIDQWPPGYTEELTITMNATGEALIILDSNNYVLYDQLYNLSVTKTQ